MSLEFAEPPKSNKKKLVIYAAAAIAFLLAGAGLYFTGMLDRFIGHKEVTEAAIKAKLPVFFDLPEFLVNLDNAGNKRANFAKLSVSLRLENGEDMARVAALMPVIVDNFQIYLRELQVEDFRGSDGIYRVREKLLARVNAAVAPVKINEVLFEEVLIQ